MIQEWSDTLWTNESCPGNLLELLSKESAFIEFARLEGWKPLVTNSPLRKVELRDKEMEGESQDDIIELLDQAIAEGSSILGIHSCMK